MLFVRHAYAAILLVTLTLVTQSAGMAALINWARTHLPSDIHLFAVVTLLVKHDEQAELAENARKPAKDTEKAH